jgi:hypothetical protein
MLASPGESSTVAESKGASPGDSLGKASRQPGGALVWVIWAMDSLTTGAPALGSPVNITSAAAQATKNAAATPAPT